MRVDHRLDVATTHPATVVVAHCDSAAGSPPSGVYVVTRPGGGAVTHISATLVPASAEIEVQTLTQAAADAAGDRGGLLRLQRSRAAARTAPCAAPGRSAATCWTRPDERRPPPIRTTGLHPLWEPGPAADAPVSHGTAGTGTTRRRQSHPIRERGRGGHAGGPPGSRSAPSRVGSKRPHPAGGVPCPRTTTRAGPRACAPSRSGSPLPRPSSRQRRHAERPARRHPARGPRPDRRPQGGDRPAGPAAVRLRRLPGARTTTAPSTSSPVAASCASP